MSLNFLLDEKQERYPLFVIRMVPVLAYFKSELLAVLGLTQPSSEALHAGFDTNEAFLKPVPGHDQATASRAKVLCPKPFANEISKAKLAASLNYARYGISPTPFPVPCIDPADVADDIAASEYPKAFPPVAMVEIRADWKFMKEVFNLKSGYTSAQICHHCFAHDTDYCAFPANLHTKPMRDLASFTMLCQPDSAGNRCYMATNNQSDLSNASELDSPNPHMACCSLRQPVTDRRVRPPLFEVVFAPHDQPWCGFVGLCFDDASASQVRGRRPVHHEHHCASIMTSVQGVWPAVPGIPAKQVMDNRLSLAFDEFQAWTKSMKVESAAEISQVPQ